MSAILALGIIIGGAWFLTEDVHFVIGTIAIIGAGAIGREIEREWRAKRVKS